jgi:hypothetical protein
MTPDCPMLIAALGYAARGWDVFPAPPGEKKSCKSAEYSNGAKWGKTRDPEQIRRDFDRWKDANVGIPTGADAGFWVVEADTPKGHDIDGIGSLRALEEKHGPLPATLMAESPSGSLHYYFKWPDAAMIKNSASGIGPGRNGWSRPRSPHRRAPARVPTEWPKNRRLRLSASVLLSR